MDEKIQELIKRIKLLEESQDSLTAEMKQLQTENSNLQREVHELGQTVGTLSSIASLRRGVSMIC